jgi:hypothetical protein
MGLAQILPGCVKPILSFRVFSVYFIRNNVESCSIVRQAPWASKFTVKSGDVRYGWCQFTTTPLLVAGDAPPSK